MNVATRPVVIALTVLASSLSGCGSTPPQAASGAVGQPANKADAAPPPASFVGVPAEEALALEVALTEAAWDCDVAAVRALLAAGADPEGVGGTKARRYLRANGLKHLELDPDVSPSPLMIGTFSGYNFPEAIPPLMACLYHDYDNPDIIPAIDRGAVVALLLDAGADPNMQLRYGYGSFPLLLAVERGLHDAVAHLLNAGADPNMSLVGFEQIDIYISDAATALDRAVGQCDLDMARLLLNAGAYPCEGGFMLVPLSRAAYMTDPEMLGLLLEWEAANDRLQWARQVMPDAMGELIDQWASASRWEEDQEQRLAKCKACFEILLEFGAHANLYDEFRGFGATAIQDPTFLAWYLEELVTRGPDSPQAFGWMERYVLDADVAGLRALVEAGLDPSATDGEGLTLLHLAGDFGGAVMVGYLIEQGADVNARDKDGDTALDYTRDPEVVALLRAAGGMTGSELGRE